MTHPRVVAVILNWNGERVLPEALESLYATDYPDLPLILVDNASGDQSLSEVEKRFAGLRVIRNRHNLGFAEGCNVGIVEGLDRRADYILLLNNDARLEANTLRQLVIEAESDDRMGIIAPSVWRADDPEVLDSAYGQITFNHVIVNRLGVSRRSGRGFMEPRDVDCVFGAVLLIRSRLFREVGLFDGDFWMFLEEVELCYRARQAGFRVRYYPTARALHQAGHSTQQAGARVLKTYLLRRNSVLFLKKHGTFFRWCKFSCCVGISLAVSAVLSLFRGQWAPVRARWEGYRDGILGRRLDLDRLMRRYCSF